MSTEYYYFGVEIFLKFDIINLCEIGAEWVIGNK